MTSNHSDRKQMLFIQNGALGNYVLSSFDLRRSTSSNNYIRKLPSLR